MFAFGHTVNPSLLLPPGQDEIITETVCPAACTQAVKEYLLASMHAHLIRNFFNIIKHSRDFLQLE